MPSPRQAGPVKSIAGRIAILVAPLLLVAGLYLLYTGRQGGGPDQLALTSNAPALSSEETAATIAAGGFSDGQKQAIEAIVKEYLLAHPEFLYEVQSAYQDKIEKEQAARIKAAIAESSADIFKHPGAMVAGNPKGDIPVVEFFDYNCGYCRHSLPTIAKLIESDKNVRVVFMDLPILDRGTEKNSEDASRVALAAGRQGKYWELHRALLSAKGRVNGESALGEAEKLGLDLDKLKADMNSAEVTAEIDRVKALAAKLGVDGTPHFLVGDQSIGGAPENLLELLQTQVAELRKTGCSYC